MSSDTISAEAVMRLAEASRMPISRADAEALSPRLTQLLAGIALLDTLPLDGVVPAPVLDPRWETPE